MKSLFPGIAAAFLVSVLASNASADPTDRIAVRLEYETPADAGCPTAESFALVLSGEFGYLIVRPDVPAVLRVEIKSVGKFFQAEAWAPDATGTSEKWHGETEERTTCRELAYDLAYMIRLRLGPDAWPNGEIPEELAAPPEITVGRVVIHPVDIRLPEPVIVPNYWEPLLDIRVAHDRPNVLFTMDVTIAGMVMPYGLSSVAVGGGGEIALRWLWYGVGAEFRAFATPASGIGEPPLPGRTSVFTGALHPCVFVPYVDFCAAATLSSLEFNLPPPADPGDVDGLSFGFGARIVGRLPLSPRLALVGFGEATAESRHFVLGSLPTAAGTEPRVNWTSPTPRVLFGFGLATTVF